MKPAPACRNLLRSLHEAVFFSAATIKTLDRIFDDLAAELDDATEPHVSRTVDMSLFSRHLPPTVLEEVRLCRAFLLAAGNRMARPEVHHNSIQRLVSYRGSGAIVQAAPGEHVSRLRPRSIVSPPGRGRSQGDGVAAATPIDLDRHWDVVSPGAWHFPRADDDLHWATVTFHSASADAIQEGLWNG